ncbi:MAG: erythronate-4-phosphate dehydrogenase, partial [Muribaculaceae bacterium]|nr:erythronate-4-phosphate dehydrogenase [Muribaculaceae bacterium]
MDVIIESHIPFIAGELERRNHRVTYLPPEAITAQTVKNADALIIRTRTRADHALLHGSRVRHVATATIGTDHIDMTYCRDHGIAVSNAPGCNAPAVAQYVISSLAAI